MMEQEHHVMVLEQVHDTGAEEWVCPTCGRRMLLKWRPELTQLILQEGDQTAFHSGSTGGMYIKQTVVESSASEETLGEEELRSLSPWLEWMDKSKFDKLWQKPDTD